MTALVIGYGNPLRTDDGLGWHAAAMLALARPDDTVVLQRHQLTPELAVDVAAASIVVFVDAGPVGTGGGVLVDEVEPDYGPLTWTYHLTPGELLALASLSGHAPPPAYIVTSPARCTDPGDGLSPDGRALLPEVLAAVAALVPPGQLTGSSAR